MAEEWIRTAVWNANWGVLKGGDLDCRSEDGDAVLRARLMIIEMGRIMGIRFYSYDHGFGQQYTLEDLA